MSTWCLPAAGSAIARSPTHLLANVRDARYPGTPACSRRDEMRVGERAGFQDLTQRPSATTGVWGKPLFWRLLPPPAAIHDPQHCWIDVTRRREVSFCFFRERVSLRNGRLDFDPSFRVRGPGVRRRVGRSPALDLVPVALRSVASVGRDKS